MKILIISYYSFPLNGVPCYRIESFCKTFSELGAEVTLLTRHWDEKYLKNEELFYSDLRPLKIEYNNFYKTIRVPYNSNFKINKSKIINRIKIFLNHLFGKIGPEYECFRSFKMEAEKAIKNDGIDVLIVSSMPYSLIKLANHLKRKFKVCSVVDIRDYINEKYLIDSVKLGFKAKLLNRLTEFYTKKWLKSSDIVSTVAPKLNDVFKIKYKLNSKLILNGFEKEYFENLSKEQLKNEVFTIRYIGSIYSGLNFDLIYKGIKIFSERYPNRKINIEFIGTNSPHIENLFLNLNLNVTITINSSRIPKEKVIVKVINSDILLLVWGFYKGNYSTKTFDFINSGSHILLCPPDNDVVEDLIRNYPNGSIANSEDEVVAVLEEQYEKWESGNNKTALNAFPEFEREHIACEFYKIIQQYISKEINHEN